jgi:hypothetical protein
MAEAAPEVVDGLDVNEVKDGLVVYDPSRDRVHYLNATASVVFTLCDGGHDRAAMGAVLAEAFGLDEAPLTDVDEALTQLADEGLLRSTS